MSKFYLIRRCIHNVWDNHKILASVIIMFGIWIATGILLHWHNPSNFISDWINSAAAIGTVGAVITSLYLANKKTSRKEYINVAGVTLTAYSDYNYISFESHILNNMNFEITVRSIRIQVDQHILFLTEAEADIFSDSSTATRVIPANKILHLPANELFWIDNNYEPIYYYLPDSLISYLINNKKSKIKLYIDSDVYSYEIESKSFTRTVESLGDLESHTKIKFEF